MVNGLCCSSTALVPQSASRTTNPSVSALPFTRLHSTFQCPRRWLCDPPGDVEERKANAVFDEDGEVVHVQHRLSGKEGHQQREQSRVTPRRSVHSNSCASLVWLVSLCMCARVVHFAFLLGRTPASDFTPALCFVRGLEANSRYCPCAGKCIRLMSEWFGITISAVISLQFLFIFPCE